MPGARLRVAPERLKKSPAPRFHAASRKIRRELFESYRHFLAAFRLPPRPLELRSRPLGRTFMGLEVAAKRLGFPFEWLELRRKRLEFQFK